MQHLRERTALDGFRPGTGTLVAGVYLAGPNAPDSETVAALRTHVGAALHLDVSDSVPPGDTEHVVTAVNGPAVRYAS